MSQFCLNGHDTAITGRYPSGNCRVCLRDWHRLHPRRHGRPEDVAERANWVAEHLGDYFRVENERGLLDVPKTLPVHGWPASGYGWPDTEWPVLFIAAFLSQAKADLLNPPRLTRARKRLLEGMSA